MGRVHRSGLTGLVALAGLLAGGCADEGVGGAPTPDAQPEMGRADATLRPDLGPLPDAAPRPDAATVGAFSREPTTFRLTVLHSNDGESHLLSDDDFGGIARFVARLNQLQDAVPVMAGHGLLTVTSGDNLLAGPVFGASLLRGRPFYDATALAAGRFDAMTLGNHDFDFGPAVLADFVNSFDPPVRFLAANLDFSAEPALAALEDDNRLSGTVVVRTGEVDVGIVGLTTPTLAQRSSPGAVGINPVVPAAEAAITALRGRGVDKIVVVSHQTSLEDEIALIAQLTDVDVMVAGGGDELMANAGDRLIPGDQAVEAYPVIAPDALGRPVPLVTTAGGYRYIGRLTVGFDVQGQVTGVETLPAGEGEAPLPSGPVRVVGGTYDDAVEPHPEVAAVEAQVRAKLDELDQAHIGFSQVPLHGRRRDLRRRATNLGALVADALRWQATDFVFGTDLPAPDVALMNGGGIRNNSIIPPGVLTELHTYEILPFASFVSLVPGVERDQFKALLENAVSQVDNGAGRFAQVSGFSFTWRPDAAPRTLDAQGNVVEPGQRVVSATLDDGTPLIADGAVVAGPDLTVATIDFLARGGDGYPFPATAEATAVSYQTALRNYIGGALEGEIGPENYPVSGGARVIEVD